MSEKLVGKINPFQEMVPALGDLEELYLEDDQRARFPDGPHRPVASANWGAWSSAKAFSHTLLSHPIFGNYGSKLLMIVVSTKRGWKKEK